MTYQSSIKELQALQDGVERWRQKNPSQHISKELWNDALELLSKFNITDVAHSIGYSATYVRRKQLRRIASLGISKPKSVQFVEIFPNKKPSDIKTSDTQIIGLNIHNREGISAELSFQGSLDQTIPIILALFKKEKQ